MHLHAIELAGCAAALTGIAQWSVRNALIVGGLAAIVAIEARA